MKRRRAAASFSFREFSRLAGELVDKIPPRLAKDLSGGFHVTPETKRDGEFYVLGEYVEEGALGCFIVLYYGSFAAVLQNAAREEWERELWETIRHELRHHLETLAGTDELVREEIAELLAEKQEEGNGST